MKYFTRALYEGYQPFYIEENHLVPKQVEEAHKKWADAVQAYMQYFDSIKSQLPSGVQTINDISFHDAIVKSVVWRTKDELVLQLDGDGCPWGVRGRLTLIFKGVKETEIQNEFIEDYWLYEEIHLSKDGSFDMQVLLDNTEFRVIADDLELLVDGRLYHPKKKNGDAH